MNIAAANAQLKNWDKAVDYCSRAIALKPKEELPHLLLADILVRRGTVAQGISELERLITDHPTSAFAHQVLGGAQMENGKLAQSIRSFLAAQQLSPEWPLPYLGAGIASLKSNEFPAAERYFRTALKLQPESVTAQLGMAGVFERTSRSPYAIKIYKSVLTTQPNLLMPLNNLAYHYAEEGTNLEVAYAMAQQAAQNFPADKSVWDTLGFVCYRAGKVQEALTHLVRAVALSPESAIAHFHLAYARQLAGKRVEAIKSYQASISLGLQEPQKSEAARAIQLLQKR
jgi:tetratricopeptide (TPR) repeat protein